MPVNLSALLQALKAQQPPPDGPAMGASAPQNAGMLGGHWHPSQPPVSLGDVGGLVGGTLADAVQGVTGWRPGTTPSWMPQSLVAASDANKAADVANAQALGKYGFTPQDQAIAMGFTGPDMIEAYHGSPHSFDAFDTSKIGTGEGAQTYGHGLYFAESEPVARSYRDALAPEQSLGSMYQVRINAEPEQFLDWDKPLSEQHPDVQAAFRDLGNMGVHSDSAMETRLRSQLADLQRQADGSAKPDAIYKKMDGVKQRLADIGALNGGEAYRQLSDAMGGSEKVSSHFSQAGIPGIRYLDQGSRQYQIEAPKSSSGQWLVTDAQGRIAAKTPTQAEAQAWADSKQTRNYVVFSDKLVDILKKYGLAGLGLLGAGGVGAAAMPNQAQAQQPELGR